MPLWNPELWNTIEEEIDVLDASLKELSLSIHGRRSDPSIHTPGVEINPTLQARPELKFEEKYVDRRESRPRKFLTIRSRHAHDVLTDYVYKQGFEVKKKYILSTGWEAKFTHGSGGRTIGVNSGDQHPLQPVRL